MLGDTRLTLAAEARTFDLLVLAAFSSDAIPVHLLTTDAISKVYLPHLAPHGRLLLHISNLYFRLDRVVAAKARALGLEARVRVDTERDDDRGKAPTVWAILARDAGDLQPIANGGKRTTLPADASVRPWTDDWSNPLDALEWRRLSAR